MNLAATSFDLENARACARASQCAYQSTTVQGTAVDDAGMDVHCLVVEEPECIVVAFRGTVSIRNWITDAEFERTVLVSYMDGSTSKIHRGFERALNSVIERLWECLRAGPAGAVPAKPIVVTGHSLGGALAILAALQLQRRFRVFQVYTFGQPRVGNGAFKERYEAMLGDCTFRVVYREDIVPRLPHLPAWHDPYRHVGTEVFFSSLYGSTLWFDPPWWRVLISDVWGIYRAFLVSKFDGALDPIRDHYVYNYVTALGLAKGATATSSTERPE